MTRLNPIAFFKASSKKPYVPSRFEQLPREIRELIYSFAGYPIHRTIWISSILRSNYETSVEVTHVELTDEKAPWPKTFAWTIMSGNDADQYLCKMDFRFPAALLQVNRMLRADLMQSLYRWKTVDIRIDLTKPSSTLSKLKNIAHFKRPTHNLGVSPSFIPRKLHMDHSSFLFMTHVKLPFHDDDKRWRPAQMPKIATTIFYLANHCPNLISLHLVAPGADMQDGQVPQRKALILAFGELAQRCPRLQVIFVQKTMRYITVDPMGQRLNVVGLTRDDVENRMREMFLDFGFTWW